MSPRAATLSTVVLCLLFCGAHPAQAQLRVCNNGKVAIDIVWAMEDERLPLAQAWYVEGWVVLQPTGCQDVDIGYQGLPSYLGFAYKDPQGKLLPLSRVYQVPDFGDTNQGILTHQVLKAAQVHLCIHPEKLNYAVKGALPETNCASLPGGPYTTLATALSIRPANEYCSKVDPLDSKSNVYKCTKSHYYMNVAYMPGDPALHVTKGTASGQDAAPDPSPEQVRQFLKDSGIIRNPNELSLRERNALAQLRQREAAQEAPQAARNLNEYWSAPVHPASEFTTQWVGQTVVLQGTVSHVEWSKEGDQRLHIWFAEAHGSDITACSPIPDALSKIYGQDFSGLMGKVLQIAGEVVNRCGPRQNIYFVDPRQLRLVSSTTPTRQQ